MNHLTKWKTQCRSRIKGCDGVIAFVSKNTAKAIGAIWEVKTAKEEGVSVIAMYTTPKIVLQPFLLSIQA